MTRNQLAETIVDVTYRITDRNFITRNYFVVFACLRQPIAPRKFRVCAHAQIWCDDLVSPEKSRIAWRAVHVLLFCCC